MSLMPVPFSNGAGHQNDFGTLYKYTFQLILLC